jgi:hypothetical protein
MEALHYICTLLDWDFIGMGKKGRERAINNALKVIRLKLNNDFPSLSLIQFLPWLTLEELEQDKRKRAEEEKKRNDD